MVDSRVVRVWWRARRLEDLLNMAVSAFNVLNREGRIGWDYPFTHTLDESINRALREARMLVKEAYEADERLEQLKEEIYRLSAEHQLALRWERTLRRELQRELEKRIHCNIKWFMKVIV